MNDAAVDELCDVGAILFGDAVTITFSERVALGGAASVLRRT